jgi:hypothetical protein
MARGSRARRFQSAWEVLPERAGAWEDLPARGSAWITMEARGNALANGQILLGARVGAWKLGRR